MTQTCRRCGCTNLSACPGQCYWLEDDLCSSCAVACVPSGEHIPGDEAEAIEAIWRVAIEDGRQTIDILARALREGA